MRGRLNLLLDTHVVVWAINEPDRLSKTLTDQLEDPANKVWVSAITIWELAIKASTGRVPVQKDTNYVIEATGFRVLPFTAQHAREVRFLPLHHKDPFDRALLAQARFENMRLVTTDQLICLYRDVVDIIP